MSYFCVGLTGGLASGKSTAARYFAEEGARVIDTDALSHELTRPQGEALPLIRKKFGETVFLPDGTLDRAAMRKKIFSDEMAKRRLEGILHPLIRIRVLEALKTPHDPYTIVVVPLLFESEGFAQLFDRTVTVDCSEERQIERAMARSGLSREEVLAIMARQLPRGARLARADDVLDNEGSAEELLRQVQALHQKYLPLAAQARERKREIQGNCPCCGKSTPLGDDNPNRPFCSASCQMMDLTDWLDERHRIPGEAQGEKEDEDI